jgi:hypothetical protein
MGVELRVGRDCAAQVTLLIPRLSKAGMPPHSEGWGGLFKDEQYQLMRSASRSFIRSLRIFEQTTPGASRPPLLTKEGNGVSDKVR